MCYRLPTRRLQRRFGLRLRRPAAFDVLLQRAKRRMQRRAVLGCSVYDAQSSEGSAIWADWLTVHDYVRILSWRRLFLPPGS